MALSTPDPSGGMVHTRQDFTLPTSPLGLNRVKHRGGEYGVIQDIEIDLSNYEFVITQASSAGYNATKIIDFPIGNVVILNAMISGPVTTGANSGATEALLVAIGTTATVDATLATTEVNTIASTSTTIAARAGTVTAIKTAANWIDGTSTAADLYLNMAQAANVAGASTATFGSGAKINIQYILCENYNA